MAPSLNKNYFLYLEDYVEKERNLRYLLKKVSQNFIMQEAFQETMLRANIYQAKETQKQPYLCDFLMLEFLDSIWINKVYRMHRENLTTMVMQEVHAVHTLERYEELPNKKEIFRKVINTIHQTEFGLANNQEFLSISQECGGVKGLERENSSSPFRASKSKSNRSS
jgi:F0F1-type ATP synthase alpha subunit